MKSAFIRFLVLAFLFSAFPAFAQTISKKKGKVTTHHANGAKEASGKVRNYMKQGNWKYWNTEGKIEKSVTYKDDQLNGAYTEYYTDGSVSVQGNYVNGKKSGTWNSFYNGNKKSAVLNYVEGQMDGEQMRWYENGQVREKSSYSYGVLNYKSTWYFTGKPRSVETYKSGKAEGTWRTYPDPSESRDTLPSSVDEYSNGLRNGVHLAYANGMRTEEIYYESGKLSGSYRKWDQTGNMGISENYAEGLRDGLCRYFDKGKLIREVNYKKGKIHGEEKEFYYGASLTRQSWYNNGIIDSAYTYFPDGKTETTRIYKYYPGFVKTEEYSLFTQYDENGKKLIQGEYHFETKDRIWTTYYPDGKTKSQTMYSGGKISGTYRKWYANGKPLIEMECSGSEVVAQPKVWDENGKPLKPGTARYNELVESSKPGELYNNPARYQQNRTAKSGEKEVVERIAMEDINIEEPRSGNDELIVEMPPPPPEIHQGDEVYTIAEEQPQFPGGQDSLSKYIVNHIKYPPMCVDAGIQGTVYVRFVVDKTGAVNQVTVVKGVPGGELLDKEAVRVVRGMPNWKPAKNNGRTVSCFMVLPVKFKLQ